MDEKTQRKTRRVRTAALLLEGEGFIRSTNSTGCWISFSMKCRIWLQYHFVEACRVSCVVCLFFGTHSSLELLNTSYSGLAEFDPSSTHQDNCCMCTREFRRFSFVGCVVLIATRATPTPCAHKGGCVLRWIQRYRTICIQEHQFGTITPFPLTLVRSATKRPASSSSSPCFYNDVRSSSNAPSGQSLRVPLQLKRPRKRWTMIRNHKSRLMCRTRAHNPYGLCVTWRTTHSLSSNTV